MFVKNFLIISLIGIIGILTLHAQHMNIEKIDGSIIVEETNSIENMLFSGNDLEINFTNSNTESVNLLAINKIYFDMGTGNLAQNITDLSSMVIYPNPVGSYCVISNLPDQLTDISIYNLMGKMVLNEKVSSDSPQLNVQGLSPGLYILTIDDVTLKLIKR